MKHRDSTLDPSCQHSRIARLGAALILGALAIVAVHLALGSGPPVRGSAVGVGLVADGPVVYDNSLNQLAYEGMLRAESELGIVPHVYTTTGPGDFVPNLQQCADDGNSLCLGLGFWMAEAISEVASSRPMTYFAIADGTLDSYGPNVRGILFPTEGAGYMAGTLAGLMTESGVVGGIGGWQIPPVEAYLIPFEAGARRANGPITVLIDYTGSFNDPPLGAQVAQQMMGEGADVIFAAAGPTGNGAILTATQSGAWAIGVDGDQYLTLFMSGTVPGADRLLSSAMKRVDIGVFETISDVVAGVFTSGTVAYDFTAGGVGLAPFHDADPYVPQDVRDALEETRQAILDGSIDVHHPYPAYVPLILNGPSP
jgi:basic membrane lipoprotein Med (substrate-binding protein (PBP1-ABC) superfamily)